MSFSHVKVIEVSAWNQIVGAVTLDPTSNFYAFEYASEWLRDGVELAPLHMARRGGVFTFPELSRSTYYGLPALLADALPDRFGNSLVTAWLAEQGVDSSAITALDRLAYAGARTMGALTFAPPSGPLSGDVDIVNVGDLVTAARSALAGNLLNDGVHGTLRQLISVGSSAGGARAKAVVAYNSLTGDLRSGQLDAPAGFEQWLLKLDGVGDPANAQRDLSTTQPYCRLEYAYYLMATNAGITMNPSRLLLEGPRAHFMTKRFDRDADDQRIHMATLCALAHLDFNMARTHSYASYFTTANALSLTAEDREQIFRRIAFNVFAVNHDDHTKNVSFLLPRFAEWSLAPAYDLTYAHWSGEWAAQHQMSVNGKFQEISLDDLRQLGDRYQVPAIDEVLRDVKETVSQWNDFAAQAGVDVATTQRVQRDLLEHRPQ
jgi:serine/threonine-protein kinase HipA